MKGEIVCTVEERHAVFGETALRLGHGGRKRAASMVARGAGCITMFWCFEACALRNVAGGDLATRLELDLRCRVLKTVRVFRTVPEGELMKLARELHVRFFDANTCIFKQGDNASSLYVIERGTVPVG